MFDSLAADQAFVIIMTNVESSSFFSANLSIFLQAASIVGELIISWNFNSAACSASMLSVAESQACTAAKQVLPSFARASHTEINKHHQCHPQCGKHISKIESSGSGLLD